MPSGREILAPNEIEIVRVYHDNEGLRNARYEIRFSDGSKRSGATDSSGNAHLADVPPGIAQVRFKPDARRYEVKEALDNPDYKSALSEADIDSFLHKYRGQA